MSARQKTAELAHRSARRNGEGGRSKKIVQVLERDAPDARRDDEKYREYFEEEQRSSRGRPARKMDGLF